jgi:hypothetical protein
MYVASNGDTGFVPRAQLFFGIAKRWGEGVEVPIAFAEQTANPTASETFQQR